MTDHLRPGRDHHQEDDAGYREPSPLGTDPQEAEPLPGDPREAQAPQEPRSSHVGDRNQDRSVVDSIREAWDRMRGKQ